MEIPADATSPFKVVSISSDDNPDGVTEDLHAAIAELADQGYALHSWKLTSTAGSDTADRVDLVLAIFERK